LPPSAIRTSATGGRLPGARQDHANVLEDRGDRGVRLVNRDLDGDDARKRRQDGVGITQQGRDHQVPGAVGGPDPGNAVASAIRRCEEKNKQGCVLYGVNNYTITGGDWRQVVPARAAGAPARRARTAAATGLTRPPPLER